VSRSTYGIDAPKRRWALRLGLRQIKGFAEADAKRLVVAREDSYPDPQALWQRSGLGREALERLAAADAFRSIGLDRRRALWALKAFGEPPLPLFAVADVKSSSAKEKPSLPALKKPSPPRRGRGQGEGAFLSVCHIAPLNPTLSPHEWGEREKRAGGEGARAGEGGKDSEARAMALLPEMPLGEHVVEDYASLNLTLKRHPLAFLRAELAREGLVPAADLAHLPVDRRLSIAGIVLIRQRPGSANGVVFITIEDETGIANLILWPPILERFRRAALGATLLRCTGRLQREESVIHIVADHLEDLTPRLNTLRERSGDAEPPMPLPNRMPVANGMPGCDGRDIVVRSRNFR